MQISDLLDVQEGGMCSKLLLLDETGLSCLSVCVQIIRSSILIFKKLVSGIQSASSEWAKTLAVITQAIIRIFMFIAVHFHFVFHSFHLNRKKVDGT
jgi:hypothetical protein